VLEAEVEQKTKKTGQVRSFSAYIRGARVFSDFSDEKWDDEMEIFYYNKANIAVAKIESNKERKFNLFGPERISIVKKKVEFEKNLAVLKVTRFGDFLSRIPQGDGINDINMSDIDKRQAIPKISLSMLEVRPHLPRDLAYM
jgi:hypothetical protein